MPLIRNGCLKVTVSRRALVKKTYLALARDLSDSRLIESLSRALAVICCKSLVRKLRNSARDRCLGRTGITVRLLGPNSHDFLSNSRPRPAPLDRVGRIVKTRCRGMAACDQ